MRSGSPVANAQLETWLTTATTAADGPSALYDPDGRPLGNNAAFRAWWGADVTDVPVAFSLLDDLCLQGQGAPVGAAQWLVRRAFGRDPLNERRWAPIGITMPPLRYDAAAVAAGAASRWVVARFTPLFDADGTFAAVRMDQTAVAPVEADVPGLAWPDAPTTDVPCAIAWRMADGDAWPRLSRGWSDLTGHPLDDQQCDRRWRAAVHPDDLAALLAAWRTARHGHAPLVIEARVHGAGGGWRWVRVRGGPVRGVRGDVVEWLGVLEDVDGARAARARALRSNAILTSVVGTVAEVLAIKDASYRYLFANSACARVMGRPVVDILGRTDEELLPADAAARLRAADQTVMRTGQVVTVSEAVPDAAHGGAVRVWTSVKAPYRDETGQIVGVIVTARDETERHAAERALVASEARLRAFVEATTGMIWIADPTGAIGHAVPAWEAFTGQTSAEYQGWGWREAIHPADRARVEQEWREAVATRDTFESEYRLRRRDGTYRIVVARAVAVRDGHGAIGEWCGAHVDVTEEREAAAALAAAERARQHERERLFAIERAARIRAEQLRVLATELTQVTTDDEVVRAVLAGALAPRGGTTAILALTESGAPPLRVAAAARVSGAAVAADALRAVGTAQVVSRVLATRLPALHESRAAWTTDDPALAVHAQALGLDALAVLPLQVAAPDGAVRMLGVLALGFGAPCGFDADDATYLRTVADLSAQAVDRVRLRAAQARELAALTRIQQLTADLVGAVRVADVADAVSRWAYRAFEAAHVTIALLDGAAAARGTPSLAIIAAEALPASLRAAFGQVALDAAIPMTEAVRTGTPIFVPSRDALLRDFPVVADRPDIAHVAAVAAVPLLPGSAAMAAGAGAAPIGVLVLDFDRPHAFDAHERALVVRLARHAADALERARLADAAESARQLAERANAAKGDFLAHMSHELRTPLNSIAGHVHLLGLGIHGPVTSAQTEALTRIQRAQRHLLGLINDVLNFARLDAGRVEFTLQPVAIAEAVRGVSAMIEPLVRAKGLTLTLDVEHVAVPRGHVPLQTGAEAPPAVLADAEKLDQVLLNVLSNAVKFTPARQPDGAPGAITVSLVSRGDGWLYVRVGDTGPGVARDKQDAIFEPFVQLRDPATGGQEGTGLGLAISRDLARGMGGDLRVRSVPGAGATFTLVLRTVGG